MADNNTDQEDRIPVFLINGFLEAGKTKFLKFTMEQVYFQTEGTTLLIVCEEGDEEYDDAFLKKTKTAGVFMECLEEVTEEKLRALSEEFHPERVLIEWNGMWMQDALKLPDLWFLNQQVSLFDTSTLELYLKNMRPYMGPMLKNTELVICNRADGIPEEKLGSYYFSLRAMAPGAEIVFEGEQGEIRGDFNIELPYDIKAEHLQIEPQMFATFYVDSMDRPERYDGKEVELTAQVMRPHNAPKNLFVPGRRVMTCCEADIQFCGWLCRYAGAERLKSGDWVKLRAKIKNEKRREYGGYGPVLYAEEVVLTGPLSGIASFQ